MSKVKIQGNASGTGVLTITAPNTSTDRTITLPDSTGTLIADDGSGNVDVTGTVTANDTITIEKAGSSKIELANTATTIVDDALIGELAFRADDTSGTEPHYTGIKARASGTFGTADIEIYSGRESYETNSPQVVIEGATTDQGELLRILAAGGITFNGDTAAANALDDYEEGTWTPTTVSGWGSLTLDCTASYTKIGNIVHVMGFVSINGSGSGSGDITIGGLPFTSSADSDHRPAISVFAYNLQTEVSKYISGLINNNSTSLLIREGGRTSAGDDMGNHFDTGSRFYFQATYRV